MRVSSCSAVTKRKLRDKVDMTYLVWLDNVDILLRDHGLKLIWGFE